MKRFSETGKIHWTRYLSKPEIAHCPFQARENRCRKTTRHNSCPVLPDGTLLFASHRVETLIPGTAVSTAIRLLTITVCRVHGIIRFLTRRTPCIWLITLHAIQLSAAPPIPSMSSYARGHSTAWEQRQLGDIAERVARRNSNNECTRVLTASAESGLVDQQEYFLKRIASPDLTNYYLLRRGDFAYNHSSSANAPFGIVRRLDTYDSGCLSSLYIVFRPFSDVDSDFLLQYFESSAWHNDVSGMVTEGARNHGLLNISSDAFFTTHCTSPHIPEQRLIGEFFSTLDSLIAAAERQEALLRQKKQAYLQLMFPRKGETQPRLRFSGFTEEWQELRLGKLYMKNTERNGNQFDAEKTLSVSSMTFNPLGNGAAEESLASYKILRIADAAFEGHTSNEFAFGRFVVNTVGAGIMSPRFASIRPTDFWWQSCDLDFWACYLHDEGVMKRILVRSTKRGTMMNELVFDDFFAGKMRVPSLPEQRLIGRFFSTLDSLISAAEKRAKHLRTLKGSYLQRMFV